MFLSWHSDTSHCKEYESCSDVCDLVFFFFMAIGKISWLWMRVHTGKAIFFLDELHR